MASYRNTFLQISKCPACGFELHKRANNMGRDISEMLRKRDSVTRSRIHKIALMINDLIPSQNRTAYWKFLIAIRDIEDRTVEYGIEQYYQAGHHTKGKGFPYLRSIIQTLGKDSDALRELERKRIGGVPPVINIEEEE
tara:strand:- start:847 stop:1263 length:417 start_codon:yes stop_codon:yes gene_type:complete